MLSKSPTEERELERERASRNELVERIADHLAEDGNVEAAPGLFLYRASAPTGPRYGVSEPSFCVVAQGSKAVLLGKERIRYDASQYLLVSVGLPAVSHVLQASKERPYLAVRLVLDPAIVTEVLIEAGLISPRVKGRVRAIAVNRIEGSLLDAVVRLVRLVDTPNDYRVLAPLAIREITYRLAIGEQGGRLRQIAVVDGRTHRMAKAIELIRENYTHPLRVPDLARRLGMSVSGLHHDFKAVTSLSPIQFQKQLRLQEARRLLLARDIDAATAGYRVGYDDASHFSREYKTLFGEPPLRDVGRLRGGSQLY